MTTATMPLTQDRSAKAPSSLLPPPSQVLTLVGALAVRDTGPVDPQGQTIVLWPSILADYRIYRHPIEVWRGRHRIIAIDGPGHGESGRSPGAFSMSDCGQALGEVLDSLTVSEPVVVVGTSWGGLVAGEFALLHPRRTLAVVMLNTPVIKAPDGPSLLIVTKNMTTTSRCVSHTSRNIAGEYGHGAKAIERGSKKAGACRTNAAKRQGLRRGRVGGGRGTPDRVHVEGADR